VDGQTTGQNKLVAVVWREINTIPTLAPFGPLFFQPKTNMERTWQVGKNETKC